MKASDRTILIVIGVVGILAALWFLMLAPKRKEVSELGGKITQLENDLAAQEALVTEGQAAQADYERNFSSLVVLGKAAPADGDMPGLLEQLVSISDEADTGFDLLEQGVAVEAPQPAAAETTADPSAEAPPEEETPPAETAPETATATAVPATEASAANLPIGATVGSAGLGVLPYDVKFTGDFFEVADLFQGIDQMIKSEAANVDVGGRLVTVNGFKMTKPDGADEASDELEVELSISTYVLPESQGLTAGGTSTAPPATVPEATPVAETTP